MTPLRQRMTEDMQIRGYAPATINTYTYLASCFAKHFGKSPDCLGPEHVRQYQIFLVNEKKISWSTLNQTVSALRLLYHITLHKKWMIDFIPYRKQPTKLPTVLSPSQVAKLLASIKNLRDKAILSTCYASGLRVIETCNLLVEDIDSNNMVMHIRQAKGHKDRLGLLPSKLLTLLRQYWVRYQPHNWLFPNRDRSGPLCTNRVQVICREATKAAAIPKRVHPHTLRHCFATHLVERGVDIRKIQLLLGHATMRATERYLHMATKTLRSTPDLLDLLDSDADTERDQ